MRRTRIFQRAFGLFDQPHGFDRRERRCRPPNLDLKGVRLPIQIERDLRNTPQDVHCNPESSETCALERHLDRRAADDHGRAIG